MDTRYGKYDGPLAALAEHWYLQGDQGDCGWTNDDGDGVVLFNASEGLGFILDWTEAEMLIREFECTHEDLNALDTELSAATGVVQEWDNHGFIRAYTLNGHDQNRLAETQIAAMNAAQEEEGVQA